MTKRPQKNRLEWLVFAVGSVLVLGTIAFLAQSAITADPSPAQLEITLGQSEPRRGHFAVPVTVYNRGNDAAEQVSIEVLLKSKEHGDERAQLQIAFLPRQASRLGWVAFINDPSSADELKSRPLGYERP